MSLVILRIFAEIVRLRDIIRLRCRDDRKEIRIGSQTRVQFDAQLFIVLALVDAVPMISVGIALYVIFAVVPSAIGG